MTETYGRVRLAPASRAPLYREETLMEAPANSSIMEVKLCERGASCGCSTIDGTRMGVHRVTGQGRPQTATASE